ncbi:DsbA family oxidoreductase [Pontibacter sp. CAU 1760]
MTKQKIKIDIVSDINCPWCYVGERRLKKAMDAVADNYAFDLSFKAFELNANVPADGMTRQEYFKKNYGEAFLPQVSVMDERLTNDGAAEGITFNFGDDMPIHNTFNGHRLIWLAGQYGVQVTVAQALFKSYFTDNENMNNPAVLTRIGVEQGIPAERLAGFFESEAGKQEVREMEQFAQSAGITSVPSFIINDQYLVRGAQPADTFLSVFQQITPAPALQDLTGEGASCGVDGC